MWVRFRIVPRRCLAPEESSLVAQRGRLENEIVQHKNRPGEAVFFCDRRCIQVIAPFVVPVLTGTCGFVAASISPKGGTTNTVCKNHSLGGAVVNRALWVRRYVLISRPHPGRLRVSTLLLGVSTPSYQRRPHPGRRGGSSSVAIPGCLIRDNMSVVLPPGAGMSGKACPANWFCRLCARALRTKFNVVSNL